VKYAVYVPNFSEPRALVDLGGAAERHGWDGCFYWDHILVSRDEPIPVAGPP
jgi:hypothetical protein